MTNKVFRHEARHISEWQRGHAPRHKLRFFKKPAALDLGEQKQLVHEIRAARYGDEPYIHFTEEYDREDISRFGLLGLIKVNEQLDLLERYLAKRHTKILTMVQNWRATHFTPVYDLHANVRNRLPEWKELILEASETSSYGGSWHVGVRVVSWFKKAWPEAEKIIKAAAIEPDTTLTPLDPENWGYLTNLQVISLLKGSCLNATTRAEVTKAMKRNIAPHQIAMLFFEKDTREDFIKGLESIDSAINQGVKTLVARHGQQTDGQDMGILSPIGSMIVPEHDECTKKGLEPSAIRLWDIMLSIKLKSNIYPTYMIDAPSTIHDGTIDKQMKKFQSEALRPSSLTPDDLGKREVNLSGVESMTEFNDYING